MENRIKLYGFNNLTKSLSFNIYDVCYAASEKEQKEYASYTASQYNAERLTSILFSLTDMIGAKVLSVSKQDYDPQGASVVLLLAEEPEETMSEVVSAHLDKSHITVHTYPEFHPQTNTATIRLDIDVATCGHITPLRTLNYLLNSFHSDVVVLDYRVRGFTRNIEGKKLFMDHDMQSIRNYISPDILKKYKAEDTNLPSLQFFHTSMMVEKPELDDYLFSKKAVERSAEERAEIKQNLDKEMTEIFNGIALEV